jgi:hypothetical protein
MVLTQKNGNKIELNDSINVAHTLATCFENRLFSDKEILNFCNKTGAIRVKTSGSKKALNYAVCRLLNTGEVIEEKYCLSKQDSLLQFNNLILNVKPDYLNENINLLLAEVRHTIAGNNKNKAIGMFTVVELIKTYVNDEEISGELNTIAVDLFRFTTK